MKISRRNLSCGASALGEWEWPVWEIAADCQGPRLCVMAGMHVNEVSSIQAVRELRDAFSTRLRRGSVSLLPILNLPAVATLDQGVCPQDGKNINFCFPGEKHGSFSEALAHMVLNDWAADADCLVDLHGGDLCEQVTPFMLVATSGDKKIDALNSELASLFDAAAVVRLPELGSTDSGRSCSARAQRGRAAVFAEAGCNGLIDAGSVAFHRDGVLRVAARLGLIDDAPHASGARPRQLTSYRWTKAGAAGWCVFMASPGDRLVAGDLVASISDMDGKLLSEHRAPVSGMLLWCRTHPLVQREADIFGMGGEEA